MPTSSLSPFRSEWYETLIGYHEGVNTAPGENSALAALEEFGGRDALWRVPSVPFRRMALLLDRSPSMESVTQLITEVASQESPSLVDVGLAFQAVGHACRTHPMVLLAAVGDVTLEEACAPLAAYVLQSLNAAPANLVWEKDFAPLAHQSIVHDGLLELAYTLRQMSGVGPDWEGPTTDHLTEAVTNLSATVARYYPTDSPEGIFLAPALTGSLQAINQRTSAAAAAAASRILLGHTDLQEQAVVSLLVPGQVGYHGLRSLSSTEKGFDENRVLRGAVDPLDTAQFAWGLERMGFQTLAENFWTRLSRASGTGFPRQLPGGLAPSDAEILSPNGRPVASGVHPVSVAASVLADSSLGEEAQRRHQVEEDLPPGRLEQSLLDALQESAPL